MTFPHNGTGLKFTCGGALTGKDVIKALDELMSQPEKMLPVRYAIFDQTGIESIDIPTDELHRIVEQCKTIAKTDTQNTVVAVVAPATLGFGLARMWGSFTEETGWESMIFRTLPEAEQWILQKIQQNHNILLEHKF